ncbi:MAG: 30S ribosomal subunit protein S16 [Candidatus Westeberhardia cardiocondylae]|nr:30S ribosomal subunit protein S16 [Candidatus Westeberhardia cardiocondylae]
MVKIRLSRRGSKNSPFYLIVVADSRSPRNGRFIEQIGFFNPFIKDISKKVYFNNDRIEYWRNKGAVMSKRVFSLINDVS